MTLSSSPLSDIPKPESVVEAIRRYARGNERERDIGRSQLRACINFYKKEKGREEVVAFLQKVLDRA